MGEAMHDQRRDIHAASAGAAAEHEPDSASHEHTAIDGSQILVHDEGLRREPFRKPPGEQRDKQRITNRRKQRLQRKLPAQDHRTDAKQHDGRRIDEQCWFYSDQRLQRHSDTGQSARQHIIGQDERIDAQRHQEVAGDDLRTVPDQFLFHASTSRFLQVHYTYFDKRKEEKGACPFSPALPQTGKQRFQP